MPQTISTPSLARSLHLSRACNAWRKDADLAFLLMIYTAQDAVAEVNQVAEHYYQERLPNVVILESTILHLFNHIAATHSQPPVGGQPMPLCIPHAGSSSGIVVCVSPHSEAGPVHATLVPSHVHHVMFEILKNAFKASVDSAIKKNANVIPPVEVNTHHLCLPGLLRSLCCCYVTGSQPGRCLPHLSTDRAVQGRRGGVHPHPGPGT